jgi:hypothetical protein
MSVTVREVAMWKLRSASGVVGAVIANSPLLLGKLHPPSTPLGLVLTFCYVILLNHACPCAV